MTTAERRNLGARIGLGVLTILALLAFGITASIAQEMTFFRLATGTTSGNYFPIGSLIANAISNPPGSRPCDRGGSCGVPGVIAVAQATAGSVENIELLRSRTVEAAMVQADIAYWAYHGVGPYEGGPPMLELRALAALYPEALHVVVRADSAIHTINDLRGRSVSIGEPGAGFSRDARVILDAYGLTSSDYEARPTKLGASVDQLVAGSLDAVILIGGFPFAAVREAAERVPIRLIGFDGAVAKRLLETLPFFTAVDIGADTYRGVPATRTLGVSALLVARDSLDADLVFGIVRALWHEKTQRQFEQSHLLNPSLRVADAAKGLSIPLHPGAERYYAETASLLNKDREPPPALQSILPLPGNAGPPSP